jgi:replicative superfamily II helicase
MTKRQRLLNEVAVKAAKAGRTEDRDDTKRFIEEYASANNHFASYLYSDCSVRSRKMFITKVHNEAEETRRDLVSSVIKKATRRVRNSLYRDDRDERAKILNDILDEFDLHVSTEGWSRLMEKVENYAEKRDELLGGRFAGTQVEPA